ncbi:anaphase-promoting complex subunit 2 [Tanacetum coccineum]
MYGGSGFVQEALEEISREKQYQEKCLSMLVNSLQLCQDDTNTSMEGKILEELSTIIAGDDKDNYNHKKTLENIGMVVHNLINLRFTSMTEDAYASAIFLLLKDFLEVYYGQVCEQCDAAECFKSHAHNGRWRAIVDGLSDVVVTNAGTIRQFAMKTCVSLLPVVGDTKGNYCKIGQAHGCTTTVINVMKKKDKMLSNFNCQHLDGSLLRPVIHQNFYYAGLNFTSPAFPCAMSDMLHAMTFVMAVLCRYIQALSAIANDQKSYRLYGLGKAGKS